LHKLLIIEMSHSTDYNTLPENNENSGETNNRNDINNASNGLQQSQNQEKLLVKGDDLTPVSIFSYSIGHFQNDICASCWFNFMTYYLLYIREMDETEAGFVLLAGQIADALATPVIGVLSDRTETKIGKRTPWYIAGTILALVSFTLIFQSDYILPDDVSHSAKLAYFIINPSIFNIGWAAVQVSHMSLLPSISLSKKKQDKMTRMRTGFTFGSQLVSLLLSLLYFAIIDDKILQYSLMTVTCVGLGLIASSIFLIYCREATLSQNIKAYYDNIKTSINKRHPSVSSEEEVEIVVQEESAPKNITWRYWVGKAEFYYYLLVYMFVRLAINISYSMIPFYCKNVLEWIKEDGSTPIQISILLIISNCASVLNSLFIEDFFLSYFHKRNHRIAIFVLSAIVVSSGCIPLFFLGPDSAMAAYFMSFLFGTGFSMGLSGACGLINDVVGSNGTKGAFVYGAYSFADKVSCGIVLFIMTQYANDPKNKQMLTIFMAFFPPFTIFCALSCVAIRRSMNNKLIQAEEVKETDGKKKKKHYGTILDNSMLTFT